jgi:DNA-3-methyladenine glycosylase II
MARRRALNRRCIETEVDLREGIKALRRKCEVMRRVHDVTGLPPLRRREAGFEGLARIVVAQQVSVASATAIWSRFEAAVRPLAAAALLRLSDDELRAIGLSRPKMRTLRAVSAAVVDGLDLDGLSVADDEDVHARLTAISGIGPWTADIYLMFCLGRADSFAAGDLALQIAAQHAFGLQERPSPLALTELAQDWRPWRGVAARLLWAYYRTVRATKSGMPV